MATQVAQTGNVVTTVRLNTVEHIYAESIYGELSVDLLFIHELNGGKGNGHVPKDPSSKGAYLERIRRHLMRKYGMGKEKLASLQAMYRENNGPCQVRSELSKLRPVSSSEVPEAT